MLMATGDTAHNKCVNLSPPQLLRRSAAARDVQSRPATPRILLPSHGTLLTLPARLSSLIGNVSQCFALRLGNSPVGSAGLRLHAPRLSFTLQVLPGPQLSRALCALRRVAGVQPTV